MVCHFRMERGGIGEVHAVPAKPNLTPEQTPEKLLGVYSGSAVWKFGFTTGPIGFFFWGVLVVCFWGLNYALKGKADQSFILPPCRLLFLQEFIIQNTHVGVLVANDWVGWWSMLSTMSLHWKCIKITSEYLVFLNQYRWNILLISLSTSYISLEKNNSKAKLHKLACTCSLTKYHIVSLNIKVHHAKSSLF